MHTSTSTFLAIYPPIHLDLKAIDMCITYALASAYLYCRFYACAHISVIGCSVQLCMNKSILVNRLNLPLWLDNSFAI